MPIREESFRIGSGRYIQRKGAISELGNEVMRVGSFPLIIGGKTALSITRDKIEKSLEGICGNYEIMEHIRTCNHEHAAEIAEYSIQKGVDVIVGVGGGVIMDFAKLIGDKCSMPVINVPTSSATCASYTPLSVCYTTDGRTVGSKHFEHEISAVIADSEIIATQPVRLLLAGVFDSLAKFIEIKHRFNEETEEYPLGLDFAYVLSKRCFCELNSKTEKCIVALSNNEINDDVEKLIFATIAATGVISGIARGSNQCALAHKFYEGARRMFFNESRQYLHGEIVGVGLLLQNFFNDEVENNIQLLNIMKKYNMPASVSSIGIQPTQENLEKYFEELKKGSAIDETSETELVKLRAGLEYLWKLS